MRAAARPSRCGSLRSLVMARKVEARKLWHLNRRTDINRKQCWGSLTFWWGSEAGPGPLTNGSGSWRSKNIRILRIQIRIPKTDRKPWLFYFCKNKPPRICKNLSKLPQPTCMEWWYFARKKLAYHIKLASESNSFNACTKNGQFCELQHKIVNSISCGLSNFKAAEKRTRATLIQDRKCGYCAINHLEYFSSHAVIVLVWTLPVLHTVCSSRHIPKAKFNDVNYSPE